MISNIIKPGSKVDIRMLQQIEQEQATGKVPQTFKTRVCDILEDGTIHLYMPMDGQKYILLPLDLRYEFVFYSEAGLYRCEGKVKERFKSNNIFMVAIEISTQMKKFQRREYFRYECVMEIRYYKLSEELAELPETQEIMNQIDLAEEPIEEKTGFMVDISGGGLRFISKEELEGNSFILMIVKLVNDNLDKEYYLVGNVIQSSKIESSDIKYENRIQFLMKDAKTREEIIRFIFEEERKNRKHTKG